MTTQTPIRALRALVLAAVALLPAALPGAILHVPAEYPTIQEAIDAADRFDEVVVEPGTYHEFNLSLRGKEITVRGTDPTDPAVVAATVVDAEGRGRVLHFDDTEGPNSVVSGLTLTGGLAEEGGGVRIIDASPLLDHLVIEGNTARKGGGGVNCRGTTSAPLLRAVTIRGNRATGPTRDGVAGEASEELVRLLAQWGKTAPEAVVRSTGGGLKAVDCSPILESSLIAENQAGQGGGAGFFLSKAVIRGTTFEGNTSIWGGAIHFRQSPGALVEDSSVIGNTAIFGGGGLGIERSNLTVQRTQIAGNQADGLGGGMVISQAAPSLTNLLVRDNVTAGDGGGMAVVNQALPRVLHGTFSGNTARRGGAFMVVQQAVATVTNSILWGDGPDEILVVNATADVTYSDVEGGWPGDGNIDADPLFADPGNGDFHLTEGSPAVDAALADAGAADDLDGDVRPGGAEFDMGSDELFGPPQILDVPGDFATIQEAIDAAFNGDEVVVEPGVHLEHSIDFRGKAVTVRSLDPSDPSVVASTVVDGGGGGSVFVLTSGETTASVLAGLTITGGAAFDGGGVLLRDSSATIDRSVVTGNSATFGNGGGIFSDNGSVVVVGSTISGNSAADCSDPEPVCGNGGGIYAVGGAPVVDGSTFADNTAEAEGGGVYQSAGVLSGVVVTGNQATLGGGVRLLDMRAEGLQVGPGNTASADGGGMYVSHGTVADSTVSGNTAVRGGGLVLLTSLVRGSTIAGNHSTDDGGGVWRGEIFDCVIEDNTSDDDGGGVALASLVDETIVRRNVALARGGGLSNAQIVRESEVLDNEGDQGGGLFVKNGLADEAVVRESLVSGNTARLGGGLALETPWPLPGWNDPVPVRLAELEIVGNQATEGGGLHCNECVGRLLASLVADNVATLRGGGVYAGEVVSVDAEPRFEVDGTIVSANLGTETGGGVGCGFHAAVQVTNTFLYGNQALDGAAFHAESCDLQVINSTVTQNQAETQGGALLTSSSSDPEVVPRVVNSILWANVPDEIVVISLGLPEVAYSDVEGGWDGMANLDLDPLFVDPDPAVADFHLTKISPMIDAARDAEAPDADFDGDERPVGDHADIGADELFLPVEEDRVPILTDVSPGAGTLLGGETVTLTGERFGAYTRVLFGSAEAEVVVVTATSLEVLTPAVGNPGVVDVTVRNFGEYTDTLEGAYEYLLPPPPLVVTLEPPSGTLFGGDTVSVTGAGFYFPMTVYFGLRPGTNVQVIDPTRLTVTTPAAAAPGPVDVVVQDPWGQTGVKIGGFTYEPPGPPRLDAVVPSSGSLVGGTSVQLLGDFLDDVVVVTFGGVPATQVVVVTPQEVQAVTPAAAGPGAVDVVVADSYGQEGLLAGGFEYLAESDLAIFELVPASGSTAGGETITVLGQGFVAPMELLVDGAAVAVTVIDPGTMEFVTPPHAAGPACGESVVEVRAIRGDGATAATAFTYAPVQVIHVAANEAIQPAIDAAAQNACILLAAKPFPGYVENLVFGSKVVSMYGADPSRPSQTVINGSAGGGSGPVVSFGASASSQRLLSGVALVQGNGGVDVTDTSPRLVDVVIQDNAQTGDGGGIQVLGGSRPTLLRVVVTGNTATDDGGGVYLQAGAAVELEDSVVSLNSATDDGGGLCAKEDAEVVLSGTIVEVNEAGGDGGGLYVGARTLLTASETEIRTNVAYSGGGIHAADDAVLDLTETRVDGNVAELHGGGIRALLRTTVSMVGGSVSGNLAGLDPAFPGPGNGGGLWLFDDGSLLLSGVAIAGNAAVTETSYGGGIWLGVDVTGLVEGCRITGNLAQVGGALAAPSSSWVNLERNEIACNQAVQNAPPPDPDLPPDEVPPPPPYWAPGVYLVEPQGSLYNNTVWGNTGGDGETPSGGIHLVESFLFPEVVNNLIADNEGYGLYCSPGTLLGRLDYNLYFGNSEGDAAHCVPGDDAVFADPLLVAPVCPEPDLTLQPTSPAIDAGDPGFPVPPGGGLVVDIGANEFGQ